MAMPNRTADDRTVTVRVPISIRRRGGRKLVLAPNGTNITAPPVRRHIDNAMVKAIARAFRWRDMLENGDYATIREIGAAENINESYVGRVLRLTLLAPEIVERIINGRQPPGLQLDALMRRFPAEWSEQRVASDPERQEYLLRYAQEASWREDNRRQSNGEQVNRLAGLALKAKPGVDFGGYWQRHVAPAN